jgi:hypothetical protein
MSKKIAIDFVWSKELALKASKLYYDYDMKNSSKRYIGWSFIAFMQFGIVGALKHDVFGLLYLSTFLVLYWYYGRWYLRKRMIEKYYDKNSQVEKEIHFVLDKEGLHTEDRVVSWSDIFKVIQFDDGILIQTSESTLFFLNEFFKSFDDRVAFINLAKENGKMA